MDGAGHAAVIYNLEDALVVALQLNAFIRHARTVRMANIAQIVNVLAPVFTSPESLFLQTIFYAFELYSTLAGSTALDIAWDGATFAGGAHSGVRLLDVTATLSADGRQLVLFVINRAEAAEAATEIRLAQGRFGGEVRAYVVNGPDIKATNGLGQPDQVYTRGAALQAAGSALSLAFEPHSLTALVCPIV